MRKAVVVPLHTPPVVSREPSPPIDSGAELLHELRTGVAGVAAAARLLRGPDGGLTRQQERRLEELMEAELARLERMLAGARLEARPLDLDEIVEDVVLSHATRGLDVRWRRTGSRALASADDVTQVLHVLLANASRHAPDSPVTISVDQFIDVVEMRVSDEGPGVPPPLHDRIFTRGARRGESPGHGLGLFVARRLVTELGGDLRLERSASGATFVVSLPSATRRAS